MYKRGFTLIEMMVSVAIFSIVMVVALGALLSMSVAARKAETLKSVVNNLNFSLDSMTRSIRTGYNYQCGTSGTGAPQDCTGSNGEQYLAFVDSSGMGVAYCYDPTSRQIRRQKAASLSTNCSDAATFLPITSPEVRITDMRFYVIGACRSTSTAGCTSDTMQPKVTIMVHGYVVVTGGARDMTECGTPGNTCSVFNLQTSVTQRIYDQ
ncbi:MAG: hypothetical protein JWO43_145 [Candidatus Adlerbacteria bacterium]|nr:hypothetical protein [Candidatus Adlerbacteria bacterium]